MNNKKGVFPISRINADTKVKVRHVSDQSIARCNQNMIASLIANQKERQRSLEGVNEDRIGIAKVLKMR